MTIDDVLRRAATDLLDEVRATTDTDTALTRTVAHRPRRPARWMAVAAAVLVVVFAAGVIVTRGDGDDGVVTDTTTTTVTVTTGPTITVSPATDLVDGQEVTVSVAGVEPNLLPVEVALCLDDVLTSLSRDSCAFDGEGATQADADGRAVLTVVVQRTVVAGLGGPPRDCAGSDGGCAIAVLAGGDSEVVAATTLAFRAQDEPQPDPELTVSPDRGLRHGDTVRIEGTGFAGPIQGLALCRADDPECGTVPNAGGMFGADSGPGGRLDLEERVWRVTPSYDGGEALDCAEVDCVLRVLGSDGRSQAVPLAFDASVPAPEAPVFTMMPSTGLRPGDPVRVQVGPLAPGSTAQMVACLLDGAGQCAGAQGFGDTLVVDADGRIDVTIPAVDPAAFGVDCSAPGACGLGLYDGDGRADPMLQLVATIPVAYAP